VLTKKDLARVTRAIPNYDLRYEYRQNWFNTLKTIDIKRSIPYREMNRYVQIEKAIKRTLKAYFNLKEWSTGHYMSPLKEL
jgi:hypothetical protein